MVCGDRGVGRGGPGSGDWVDDCGAVGGGGTGRIDGGALGRIGADAAAVGEPETHPVAGRLHARAVFDRAGPDGRDAVLEPDRTPHGLVHRRGRGTDRLGDVREIDGRLAGAGGVLGIFARPLAGPARGSGVAFENPRQCGAIRRGGDRGCRPTAGGRRA